MFDYDPRKPLTDRSPASHVLLAALYTFGGLLLAALKTCAPS